MFDLVHYCSLSCSSLLVCRSDLPYLEYLLIAFRILHGKLCETLGFEDAEVYLIKPFLGNPKLGVRVKRGNGKAEKMVKGGKAEKRKKG